MAKRSRKPAKAARGGARSARRPTRGTAAAKRTAQRGRAPARKAKGAAPRRARKAAPVPKGMHTVTPSLLVSDAAGAIAFYAQAFGAKERMRMLAPGTDQIWHSELKIGDSIVFLSDAMDRPAPSVDAPAAGSIWLYVPNCDAVYDRAVAAGAKPAMPMSDAFWGDRTGMLVDPFGIVWGIATHKKDMTQAQMRKAGEEFARQQESAAASEDDAAAAGALEGADGGSSDASEESAPAGSEISSGAEDEEDTEEPGEGEDDEDDDDEDEDGSEPT